MATAAGKRKSSLPAAGVVNVGYSTARARRTISDCSTIQKRLLEIFDLQRFLPAD